MLHPFSVTIRGGRLTACWAVLVLAVAAAPSWAQLDVDFEVLVSEVDGVFRYDYTLANLETSSVGVNGLLLTVADDADIEFLEFPNNWLSDYAPEERNLQVAWLSNGDEFDIPPGEEGVFSISSLYGPGEDEYFIAKFTADFSDVLGAVDGSISVPNVAPMMLACDLDGNGVCDAADIDALFAATPGPVPPADAVFDINGDGTVNKTLTATPPSDPNSDLDDYIRNVLGTEYGDADLNQMVEFQDFLTLSASFGDAVGGWADGNFNGQDGINFADFLLLSANFGFDGTGAAAAGAVPEPGSGTLILLALAGLAGRRRRVARGR